MRVFRAVLILLYLTVIVYANKAFAQDRADSYFCPKNPTPEQRRNLSCNYGNDDSLTTEQQEWLRRKAQSDQMTSQMFELLQEMQRREKNHPDPYADDDYSPPERNNETVPSQSQSGWQTVTYPDGWIFEGWMENGSWHGSVLETRPADGFQVRVEYVNGLRVTQGQCKFPDIQWVTCFYDKEQNRWSWENAVPIGDSKPKDYGKPTDNPLWYKKFLSRDNPIDMYTQENRKNTESMADAHRKACDTGIGSSCFVLAEAYSEGTMGLRKNVIDAKYYYQRACSAGHSESCASNNSKWKAEYPRDMRQVTIDLPGLGGDTFQCGSNRVTLTAGLYRNMDGKEYIVLTATSGTHDGTISFHGHLNMYTRHSDQSNWSKSTHSLAQSADFRILKERPAINTLVLPPYAPELDSPHIPKSQVTDIMIDFGSPTDTTAIHQAGFENITVQCG